LEARGLAATRRDFLTTVGFSLAAATVSSCSRGRAEQAIPFLNKPEVVTPGVATYYSTTCAACSAGCGLVIKTRDGRPIKVEGNEQSPFSRGGTCAVGQAAVLSLYDEERLKGPRWLGRPTTWQDLDARITERMAAASAAGGDIVLLSSTILSPSTLALIAEWSSRYPSFRHVIYDAVSSSALKTATSIAFGADGIPHYRFDRADLVVGIEADFLGTWLSPVEFTHQYANRRRPDGPAAMSRHVQFESGVSLTGSNADERFAINPSEQTLVVLALLADAARRAGVELAAAIPARPVAGDIAKLGDELWRHRGKSLVVCGSQDVATQVAVLALNALLGNVGVTVDVGSPSHQKQGQEPAVADLVERMTGGGVHVLMLYGVNPVYDLPDAARFTAAMRSVALTLSFADRLDETAAQVHAVCPDHHAFEAWTDAEPVAGSYSLTQPTIRPLFDTRGAQSSLLRWLGADPDFYAYIRAHWRRRLFPAQQRFDSFDAFWDHALHDGVFEGAPIPSDPPALDSRWKAAVAELGTRAAADAPPDGFELHLYETVAMRDGRHANNPWLQSFPDPVTKVTWGNYAVIAPAVAQRRRLTSGDVVRVSVNGAAVELPAYVQPGHASRTIGVALGYGRASAGKVGTGVGVNGFPLVSRTAEGRFRYWTTGVALASTGRVEPLATTQPNHNLEGRPIAPEMSLTSFLNDREPRARAEVEPSLWDAREHGDHSWGLAIDLNSCTGCSACVTACQAENNVPVVGKDEVLRGREMHWLRVDHYTTESGGSTDVSMQPMMCQHCENAPCETVCPVLATVHSSDGLNQQIYNRCIGTRYCANNCPYKVRRFNWFEYAQNTQFDFNMNNPVGRLSLNPDVVVRSRGVMEKCSMCIQRIQAGTLAARLAGRPPADGDIVTACQQACPAHAIVFGDLDDPRSEVAGLWRSGRRYRVLEELGTRPHVAYLSRVRNRSEA
jgi:molybdopterin-containing oxidoreductase family iron-sulfur binding subunit